jgi:hypothetical protein
MDAGLHTQMYSVKAELSAIQLIYLQCFFTSLTEYIFGGSCCIVDRAGDHHWAYSR